MKSKIKHVTGNGTYESKFGVEVNGKKLMYKFEYTFEDGVTLNAGHKSETCPFNIGDEVEYEVKREHETYGKSGTVKKPDDGNGFQGRSGGFKGPDQDAILYQVCLKGSMDFYNANSNGVDINFTAQEVCSMALEIAKQAKQDINTLKSS